MDRRTRRTFTIDPDVSEKIDTLVGGHSLEINVLVNKAIRRYVEWGRYVDSFRLVTSDPRLMKMLWSHVPVEEARKMGTRNGNDTVVEFILYYFRKLDMNSVLDVFRVIGAGYANAYLYSEFGDSKNRTVILRHGMGRGASAFYGASLKALCNRLGVGVDLDESDDQLICKISSAGALKTITPKDLQVTDG